MFTIIVPFWNGHKTIDRLLESIPENIPVLIVDDMSDSPYPEAIRLDRKGYFTGAVNKGMSSCDTDVLILNQDTYFEDPSWLDLIENNKQQYGLIGEGIKGNHPAWPRGYIHGTFMYIRRDVIDRLGPMNEVDYPLWGSTCEYQLRAARQGFDVLILQDVPGFVHTRQGGRGSAITEILKREPSNKGLLIRTPPMISVIIPTYQHGKYLPEAISSLIGGDTSLGRMEGQTFQSFEVIIVDDGSTDETEEIGPRLADPLKGIHYIRQKNAGTPAANNAGIRRANGQYITILCGDDMMEPDRLERMYRHILQHPHSVVYDDLMFFAKGQRGADSALRPGKWIDYYKLPEYDFEDLLVKNSMHCGILFPKSAWSEVGGYPEEMRYGREDWAFNIRLGISGWCGIHLKNYAGYLYRREGQNRTLTNTTPQWRQRFVDQLHQLFPDVYGGHRPEMCCGNKKGSSTKKKTSPVLPLTMTGQEGMVLIQYVGGNSALETWWGPATGTRYDFGGRKTVGYVSKEDLEGMLKLTSDNRPVFRRYVPPKKIRVDPVPLPDPDPVHLPDPGKMTVSQFEAWLASSPDLDQDQIRQLIDQEISGKDRQGILKLLGDLL